MKPLGHDKRMYSKDLTDEDLRKMEDYNNTGREEYMGRNLIRQHFLALNVIISFGFKWLHLLELEY